MAATEGQRVYVEEVSVDKVLTSDRSGDQFQSSHSGPVMPSQESGLMSPPPRPESLASRASNRLSLSLPIQAGERDAAGLTRHTPTDSNPSTRQASPLLDVDQKLSISASNEFLVALAAQERRVLELKEELYRAESQLKKLKRQWALHEASRNTGRSGVENTQVELRQIRPTISGIDGATGGEIEDKPTRRSLNMDVDRRKAMLAGSTKDSRRKVITGGHTRALSLLSPVQGPYGQTTLVSQALNSTKEHPADEIVSPNASQPLTSQNPMKSSSNKARHSYQGSATIGVKQIAEDIKSGLWTFMEDLRQATVGEEAIKGVSLVNADVAPKGSGRKGGRGTSMAADQNLSRSPRGGPLASKTRETERRKPAVPADARELVQSAEMITHTPTATGKKMETSSSWDDDWSNWDSPLSKEESGRWSNSTAFSSQQASDSSRLGLRNK
jgi:hypothetical protein